MEEFIKIVILNLKRTLGNNLYSNNFVANFSVLNYR